MGDLLIGFGVLLAIIGPLLLIPAVWIVYRMAARVLRGTALGARSAALVISVLLVAVVMVASYLPGKLEFDRLCAEHGEPRVAERVHEDGFYRSRMFPYEAHGFLDVFRFVEAPDPYKKDVKRRYSLDADGELRDEEVSAFDSRYEASSQFRELQGGITMTEKVVSEIASGRELARAANLTYDGGPLSLFLGSYGMSSCPDILSAEGSERFRTFYDLERIVLRAEEAR